MAQLEKLGTTQDLIDIVHLGSELEDVQNLAPERLRDSLEEIQAKGLGILSELEHSDRPNSQAQQWMQI